ncbi:hypothetical protein FACS1894169_08350 [Bacteroidia bacterium]|nr:hypothetical protein FACS1894169_08350 [Bacteroidia bacterium]
MRKYIVLIVLCTLSLLKTEAQVQPKDSIWNYNFGYDFDKGAFLKDMEAFKGDLQSLDFPDFSSFNYEFYDSIFKYYKMDTAGLSKLKNFAFADSEKLKELREMSENFKVDTALFGKFKNFKIDTTGFRRFRGLKVDTSNFRVFRGMQKPRVFNYKNKGNDISQKTPDRIEKKTFSNITKVNFEHQYGNIVVQESPSKQVDLEIQYFDTNGKKAIANIVSANNTLTVKTINTGSNSGRINYVISVPKNTALDVNLKHGNIVMDNYQGAFSSNLAYSNLKAGSFMNAKPVIRGSYGNVKIDNVQDITINASYTNVKIDNVNKMELSGRYNNYKIDKVKDIVNKSEISGSFKIGSIDKIDGDMKYVNMVIDNLTSSFSSNCDYSNIKINNVSPRLVNININGRYSDVVLTIPENVSASFNVDLKNGNFNVDKRHAIKYTEQSGNARQVIKKGQIGLKKPTAVISISNSYADVKIK